MRRVDGNFSQDGEERRGDARMEKKNIFYFIGLAAGGDKKYPFFFQKFDLVLVLIPTLPSYRGIGSRKEGRKPHHDLN